MLVLTDPLLALLLVPALYALARFAGRVIERHYSDLPEVLGVGLLGACLLAPFALPLAGSMGGIVRIVLAVAVVVGLFRAPRTA